MKDIVKKIDNSPENELSDIVAENLDILFVGYNPGIESARVGHHYAGKSNRFWRLLYESGLTPFRLKPEEDCRLLEFGYGSTNIVQRPSRSADEISREEFAEGSKTLESLIKRISPRIVCYVGIGIYRVFAANVMKMPGSKIEVKTGVQKSSLFDGIVDYVCSNPSGLNTIPYPDQLKCFSDLRGLL